MTRVCQPRFAIIRAGRSAPPLVIFGQEGQRGCVLGADNPEVPLIEGGYFMLTQPFQHSDDRGINKAKREIGILATQLAYANVVSLRELNDPNRALFDVGKERVEGRWSKTRSSEPIQLDHHGGRYQ